jgi:hypothetical protein
MHIAIYLFGGMALFCGIPPEEQGDHVRRLCGWGANVADPD